MPKRSLVAITLIAFYCVSCSAASPPDPTITPEPTQIPAPTPTPSPADSVQEGWETFKSGDLETAEAIANQLIEEDNQFAEARALLGEILFSRGELDEAIFNYDLANKLGYKERDIHKKLAGLYLFLINENIEKMYSTYFYEEIDGLVLETQKNYWALTRLPEEVKNIPPEISTLIDRNPILAFDKDYSEEVVHLYEQGTELMENEQYSEAIDKLTACLEIYPDHLLAQLVLTTAFYETGQLELAFQHLQGMLEQRPDIKYGYIWLLRIYSDLYLPEHARDAYINLQFIPDGDSEEAKELLSDIENLFSTWDTTSFYPYGFGLSFSSNLNITSIEGDELKGTAILGTKSEFGTFNSTSIVWDDKDSMTFKGFSNPYEMIDNLQAQDTELSSSKILNETQEFAYNRNQIFYRYFTIQIDSLNSDFIGISAAWLCDNTMYTISQLLDVGETEQLKANSPVFYYFNPVLESITCDVPSVNQDLGF